MGIWPKRTNTDPPPRRTPTERRRREREIRAIDTGTANWLRSGGTGPRKGD
nr:hypothetical protein KPHV_60580 [Kitasatospora purpeofusca]